MSGAALGIRCYSQRVKYFRALAEEPVEEHTAFTFKDQLSSPRLRGQASESGRAPQSNKRVNGNDLPAVQNCRVFVWAKCAEQSPVEVTGFHESAPAISLASIVVPASAFPAARPIDGSRFKIPSSNNHLLQQQSGTTMV